MNPLLRSFKKSDTTSEEPALKVGGLTTSVASLLSLIAFFAPNLLSERATTIILVLASLLLPIGTAVLIRKKVWSPASVQELLNEAIEEAMKELQQRKRIEESTKLFPRRTFPDSPSVTKSTED